VSLDNDIDAARDILNVIQKRGPRDNKGVLFYPYYKWAEALAIAIEKADAWQKHTAEGKEANHAHDQSNGSDKDSPVGP
jgi:hypothetical protein